MKLLYYADRERFKAIAETAVCVCVSHGSSVPTLVNELVAHTASHSTVFVCVFVFVSPARVCSPLGNSFSSIDFFFFSLATFP